MNALVRALSRAHLSGYVAVAVTVVAAAALLAGCLDVLIGAAAAPATGAIGVQAATAGQVATSLMGWTVFLTAFTAIFLTSSTAAFAQQARRRESALLRLSGASPAFLRRVARREALLVGLAGGAVGWPLGWPVALVVHRALAAVGFAPEHMDTTPRWWSAPIVIATCAATTLLGAWAPARRAGRIGPLEALGTAGGARRAMTPARWVAAAACAGGALALSRIRGESDMEITVIMGTSLAVLAALAALAPVVVPAVCALIGGAMRLLSPGVGLLAAAHARHAAARTAALALPVLLGLGVTGTLTTIVFSANSSREAGPLAPVDLVVTGGPEVSAAALGSALTDPAVDAFVVSTSAMVPGVEEWGTAQVSVQGLDLAAARDVLGAEVTGDVRAVARGEGAATAYPDQWPVGSTVRLMPPGRDPVDLPVVAAVSGEHLPYGELVLAPDVLAGWGATWADAAWVRLAPGASVEAVGRALSEALPGARVATPAQAREAERSQARAQNAQAVLALIGAALVMALVALVVTQVAGIRERAGEFAVLRRCGAGRRRIAAVVGTETLLVLGVAGAAVAVDVAWVRACMDGWLARTGLDTVAIVPAAALAAALGVAGVIALAAALVATLQVTRPVRPGV